MVQDFQFIILMMSFDEDTFMNEFSEILSQLNLKEKLF